MSWIDVQSYKPEGQDGYYGQDLFLDILKELKEIKKLLEKITSEKTANGK